MAYETIEYDFNNLTKAISDLTSECPYQQKNALCNIKKELNCFFKDFICTEAILTCNTDNEFFGIQISPMFGYPEGCIKIFDPDCDIKYHHYLVEFDSKLFNGDFTARQIVALLIHDINRLNTPNILKDVVAAMDHISMCHGHEINLGFINANIPFFLFALQDTCRKMTSAFEYIPSDLSLADDFVRSYGLAKDYEDGMFAVKKCRNNLKDQICCCTITLNWFMQKYIALDIVTHKDIKDDIREAIKLTGSKLVRRLLNQTLDCFCMGRTPTERYYYSVLTEAAAKKKMSLASQIKYSGLKSLEDDVYEYRMRIKNVETENDAIYIVRQINNRMGLISDYLENEELSELDRERFFKLYDKYDSLREELSKKSIYNRKMYGLFVDYNALQQMSNGSMTMNTYY